MNHKISVIIPAHNSEKSIKRCLDSINIQIYNNLEIIVINDGSTDSTLQICQRYQQIDNRIRIISQRHSGVAAARNLGIETATGGYISFVDADDAIDEDYFLNLISGLISSNAEIAVSNVRCIDNDTEFLPYGVNNALNIESKEAFVKKVLNFEIGNAVWGKLFKRELIQNLRFKNLSINEDFIFFWEAVIHANIFFIDSTAFYNYYISDSGSLSKSKFCEENMSLIDHIEKVKNDVILNFPNLASDLENYYGAYLLHNLLIYYSYISSSDVSELYLDEIGKMLSMAKDVKRINNHFLVSEKSVDIHQLVYSIDLAIKKCR